MADEDHLALLKQGVKVWNSWRQDNSNIEPDLARADLRNAALNMVNLSHADLSGANISYADLSQAHLDTANLDWADLGRANLYEAKFGGAYLSEANLYEANLIGADLSGANLSRAYLGRANLSGSNFSDTDLSRARLYDTIFNNVDLSGAKGLECCEHIGPSSIDFRTLQYSKDVPIVFWRGCGLPDRLIDYMPSFVGEAINFYSCFISYSSKDHEFAHRLHADLQSNGVRCWFAPEDLKIGDRVIDAIDDAIRFREKLLLILSATSVRSAWVAKEVRTALEEEEREGKAILFPVRLDDAIKDTTEQWAYDIKRNRHIGDFTHWKDQDAYQTTFERLLRDLKVER